MPKDGRIMRERILNTAERMVLHRGYSGTSIDELLKEIGITKGAFFYHFKSKLALARALIEKHARDDAETLESYMSRAEKLTPDPLHQLIVFVGLFEEMAEGLERPPEGCLFAAYVYEQEQFDEETLEIAARNFELWRNRIGKKIEEALALHTPRVPVSVEDLADGVTAVFEGAFVMSKVMKDPGIFARQLREYKTYLQLLFAQEDAGALLQIPGGTEAAEAKRGG